MPFKTSDLTSFVTLTSHSCWSSVKIYQYDPSDVEQMWNKGEVWNKGEMIDLPNVYLNSFQLSLLICP